MATQRQFTTRNLLLRKLNPTDSDFVFDMLGNPRVMEFIGPRRALTRAEAADWLASNLARYGRGWNRWAVAAKDTDEFLGMVGIQTDQGVHDFGYYFREAAWGRGIALEAVTAAAAEIADQGIAFETFVATRNARSMALARKAGFRVVATLAKDGEEGCSMRFGTKEDAR